MPYVSKRKKMIKRLHEAGIKDAQVLDAMGKIPREIFVPQGMEHQAYDEKALPIGFGQTISHPYTVAFMSEILQLKSGNRVLEIGTGSGYQCAVLCEMGAHVFSVEIVSTLAERARKMMKYLNYMCALKTGDGSNGWAQYAPYDKIIVTAGAPVTPSKLLTQLKTGGRMIIPVGKFEEQDLQLYINTDKGIQEHTLEKFKFVPMRGKEGWKQK
jgi:protein-L-isoaspartate(D-aspartate) O-methyltransferase